MSLLYREANAPLATLDLTVDMEVVGTAREDFAPVVEAFRSNFTERGELGASLCVMVHHEVVVDVAAGSRDQAGLEPFRADTLVNFYSSGKPIIASVLMALLERHGIALDEPVATLWPEFAAQHKERATLRHALSHRAGVPAIRADLTNDDLYDFDGMSDALANSAPYFEPGSRHVYHTNTYGHLIGQLVQRLGGQSCGDAVASFFRRYDLDLYVGVPDVDLVRCAFVHLDAPSAPTEIPPHLDDQQSMIMRGYFNPPGYSSFGVVNDTAWRQAVIPSTNGHGTARGLARFYDLLLSENSPLSKQMLEEASRTQSAGYCPVLDQEVSFGLGFQPSTPTRPFGRSLTSFGHYGTGGSVGFCDPERQLAVGYVMNHVIPRWRSTRNRAIIDATYDCL